MTERPDPRDDRIPPEHSGAGGLPEDRATARDLRIAFMRAYPGIAWHAAMETRLEDLAASALAATRRATWEGAVQAAWDEHADKHNWDACCVDHIVAALRAKAESA